MDVPHHGDRCFDMHDIALLHEQLLCLGTDGLNDWLGQELLAVEPFDAFVQVDGSWKECQLLFYTEARKWARAASTAGCDTNDVLGRPGMATVVERVDWNE